MATTGYQAGVDTTTTIVSLASEAAWGTLPAVAFKALRLTSESLGSNKSRQRAPEIDATRQAADMVTTQFTAGGTISGAMSVGTYDTLFESALGANWATDVLSNGTVFQSVYIQKQLTSALYLRYPGSFCTGFSLNVPTGGFCTASFNIAALGESSATANASTGAVTAAPTGNIINTVSMVSGITLGGTGLTKVESLSLNVNNEGANALYALGSANAAGMLPGVFTVMGKVRIYFSDFTLYTRYVNETTGAFSFTLTDGGTSYLFELLNSALMNPNIVAGGVSQPVMAEFDIEGRKDSVTTQKTLRITRDLTP